MPPKRQIRYQSWDPETSVSTSRAEADALGLNYAVIQQGLHCTRNVTNDGIPVTFYDRPLKPSTPQNTFAAFSNAVQDTGKEIRQFKDTIRSSEAEKGLHGQRKPASKSYGNQAMES
ncbi:hypothetical protein B0H65DRAFT_553701 [Neurospora tetraspora]|uniref:Uncharacterized protein n=1 Tax=Neurospora tetraspora TaxID=94610 RepID=A0AAE0J0M6_9PEZI|nr:hypothetical protein B0H65DRAFT_553701 [Neurospora tetraspora]